MSVKITGLIVKYIKHIVLIEDISK